MRIWRLSALCLFVLLCPRWSANAAWSQDLGDPATNDKMAALPLITRGVDHHYNVRFPGVFFIPITITNTCSSDQVVGLSDPVMEWRDTELRVPAGGSKLVYWGVRLSTSFSTQGSLFGPPSAEPITLDPTRKWAAAYARHAKSINPANGNICEAAEVRFGETVTIDDSPDSALPNRARLDEALELILVEEKVPPATRVDPPKTAPETPQPAPPDDPTPGIGLDYPALPIPDGSVTPPAVDAPAGVFTLFQDSDYSLRFNVINDCNTPQRAYVRGLTGADGKLPPPGGETITVPPHSTAPLTFPIHGYRMRIPQSDSFAIEAKGDGDDTCIGSSTVRRLEIKWSYQDPQGVIARGGMLGDSLTVKLSPKPAPATPKNTGTHPEEPVPFMPDPVPGCSEATDCVPFDGCGSGTCGDVAAPGRLEVSFQVLGAETVRVRIEVTIKKGDRGVNPLGLLSKSFSEFIDWWMPTLQAAEQNLQQGLQFLITSRGGSTGKNMTMQVLNFTGKPLNLEGMLALEPLKKDAQQKATQAFAKLAGNALPAKVDLNGYCFEFLKLPPIAGQIMRVAPPDVQKKFEPLKKVMSAANRVMQTGGLHPDSNPAAYGDSIKQWAIWTLQEKFDQSRFADAFVNHTKKNVEAAGQKWSSQIEAAIRQAAANRWSDISQVLKAAGAPR